MSEQQPEDELLDPTHADDAPVDDNAEPLDANADHDGPDDGGE